MTHIIQLSTERSGSTLAYNLLRSVIEKSGINTPLIKQHPSCFKQNDYYNIPLNNKMYDRSIIFATQRDIFEELASRIRVYYQVDLNKAEGEINNLTLKEFKRLSTSRKMHIRILKSLQLIYNAKVITMSYTSLCNKATNDLTTSLSRLLPINRSIDEIVESVERSKLEYGLTKEAAKEISTMHKDFNFYDTTTKIHGNHISEEQECDSRKIKSIIQYHQLYRYAERLDFSYKSQLTNISERFI